jgi:hypothetical protein
VSIALSDTTVLVADKDVFSCELAGGQALLDLRTSTYYSINAVGAHVWGLLQKPAVLADITRSVTEAFDVDADRARADIMVLVGQFAQAGLVQVDHEKPG